MTSSNFELPTTNLANKESHPNLEMKKKGDGELTRGQNVKEISSKDSIHLLPEGNAIDRINKNISPRLHSTNEPNIDKETDHNFSLKTEDTISHMGKEILDLPTTPHKTEELTPSEIGALQSFIDEVSTVFGINEEDVMAAHTKIHTTANNNLPDMHKTLRHLDELPENLRNDLTDAAATLVVKDMGHEWGLSGKITVNENSVPMEGSLPGYMPSRASSRLDEYFLNHPMDSSANLHIPLSQLNQTDRTRLQNAVKSSIAYGCQAREFTDKKYSYANEISKNLEENGIALIPSGWKDHAVNIVLYTDSNNNNYLVYTNRGQKLHGESLNERSFDMQVFKITKPITTEMIEKLMLEETTIAPTKEQIVQRMKFFEGMEDGGMHDLFGLESLINIEKKMQKVGNCDWANTMGGIHAAILMILMDKKLLSSEGRSELDSLNEVKDNARQIYKSLTSEIRAKQLTDFLALYDKIEKGEIKINKNDYLKAVHQIRAKLIDKVNVNAIEEKKFLNEIDAFLHTVSIRESVKIAKEKNVPFEANASIAQAELSKKPAGSSIITSGDKEGEFVCLFKMPDGKVASYTEYSLDNAIKTQNEKQIKTQEDEIRFLREQGKHKEYEPGHAVFLGRLSPKQDLDKFMSAKKSELKDGDYIVIHTKELPDGLEGEALQEVLMSDKEIPYNERTIMIIKSNGIAREHNLKTEGNPKEPLFLQIEGLFNS